MVWLALVVAAVPAERWADEAMPPVSDAVEAMPSVGPVVGAHIGASLGSHAPDLGVRAGARFGIARHVGLSAFVDLQWAQQRPSYRCSLSRACPLDFTTTLLSGVARIEFITDGHVGPLLGPRFTAAVFVGGGVAFVAPYEWRPGVFEPPRQEPFARVGLHLGMTRLPNDWWFPFFFDLGTLCNERGCNELNFVAGVGI